MDKATRSNDRTIAQASVWPLKSMTTCSTRGMALVGTPCGTCIGWPLATACRAGLPAPGRTFESCMRSTLRPRTPAGPYSSPCTNTEPVDVVPLRASTLRRQPAGVGAR